MNIAIIGFFKFNNIVQDGVVAMCEGLLTVIQARGDTVRGFAYKGTPRSDVNWEIIRVTDGNLVTYLNSFAPDVCITRVRSAIALCTAAGYRTVWVQSGWGVGSNTNIQNAVENSHATVVFSAEYQTELETLTSVPPTVRQIYPAIDTGWLHSAAPTLSDAPFKLMYYGRTSAVKRLAEFLAGFEAGVIDELAPTAVEFNIYGPVNSGTEAGIQTYVTALSEVTWSKGFQSWTTLQAAIRNHHMVILPSAKEAYGLVFMEAIGAHIPVACFDEARVEALHNFATYGLDTASGTVYDGSGQLVNPANYTAFYAMIVAAYSDLTGGTPADYWDIAGDHQATVAADMVWSVTDDDWFQVVDGFGNLLQEDGDKVLQEAGDDVWIWHE